MRVLVVGSSSFVGKNIISTLRAFQHDILGLQRSALSTEADYTVFSWALGQPIPSEILGTINWIVFCAHDVKSEANNREGYRILLSNLDQHSKIKSIYISSFSAFSEAPSTYGRIKFELENEFIKRHHFVVRPGLVIGQGGLFQDLYKSILGYPIVPIIGFQNAPISFVDAKDLSLFIKDIIEKAPEKKEFNVFNSEYTTQVDLARAIKCSAGKPFLFLRLPIFCFEFVVFIGQILKIKLPITKENLEGYKKNTTVSRNSDIEWLEGYKARQISEIVKI